MPTRHPHRPIAALLLLGLLKAEQAVAQAQTPDPGNDIHEIRGLIFPVSWWDWGKWFILGLILLALMGLAIYWWMKRRAAIQAKTIEQAAFDRLQAAREFLEQNKAREFSIETSETIREYIEKRFSMRATNLTTEEFLRHIVSQPGKLQDEVNLLVEFLQLCDLAKFARTQLTTEQMENMYATAWQFITTSSQPAPPATGDAT